MSKSELPIKVRWHLAERRAERAYDRSPDKGLSFGTTKVNMAGDRFWSYKGAWIFQFGAYGTTHVLAYGALEDALEDAAAWLKKNAPGHLCEPDYDSEMQDRGFAGVSIDSCEDDDRESVMQAAETDLTYTESGWLTSHEWTCTELHSPQDLLKYVRRES